MKTKTSLMFLAALTVLNQGMAAEQKPAEAAPETLDATVIDADTENNPRVQKPFFELVEGTRIYAGKKASVIDLDALPKVQANNYRQALAKTPGLMVSEETSPLVSLGYRGIGEPHRTQFMQVLKDGIPIHADPFGYPEAYYTPPLDVVDRVEFVRGGASLMYGTQPGGALNYITHMPSTDKAFNFRTQNIVGTDSLFSNFTSVDGTIGNVGYYGYYNHRQSDGFRASNSDYELNGGHSKFVMNVNDHSRWIVAFDLYTEEHGEPGGLTAAQYAADRNQTTRPNDRFRLRRDMVSVEYQNEIQKGTELDVKAWRGYYDRYSARQRTSGGALINSNTVERQQFETFGIEPRMRHDWQAWGQDHTLSLGMQYYTVDSPRSDARGSSATATSGLEFRNSFREVDYFSFFAENKFSFGRLSLTPGVRFESIQQDVTTRNLSSIAGTVGTYSKENEAFQPLFGLGANYELDKKSAVYANISQSYRGAIFTESVIPTPGATIAGDIDPALSWSYELGYRGEPTDWFNFDTSVFLVDLDNRFGVISNQLQSVGRSINYGWEAAAELDLIGAWDAAHQSNLGDRLGKLSLYGNFSLLQAELQGGPNDGGTPQYAPDYMVRSGLIWSWKDSTRVAFLGTFVDDHNASDNGAANFAIPGYMTWDLTAEVKVHENVTLQAGLNNVFDEDYYSRVRSDGIDPAYGRNFYVGASVSF